MKNDVLNYIEYLKNNHNFLLSNYKDIFIFMDKLINNDNIYNHFYKIEQENNKKQNFNSYNDETILNCVYSFFLKISNQSATKFHQDFINGNIIYNEDIKHSQFITKRNTNLELEQYIINITKTNTIKDCFKLIHEFTHYLINKINENKQIDKSIINIYDEAIAIYMELLFYDFIKNKMSYEDATKIINNRLYNWFNQGYDLFSSYKAINLICNNKTYDEVTKTLNDDIFFNNFKDKVKNNKSFSYDHFFGTIIAINLYQNRINIIDLINLINENKIDELNNILTITYEIEPISNYLEHSKNKIN